MLKSLEKRLQEFDEDVNDADYLLISIGYALEYLTKYRKLVTVSGKEITVHDALEDIRHFVWSFKMKQFLKSNVTGLLRVYITFRKTYGNKNISFDEANRLFRACGLDIKLHTDFVEINKGRVKFLDPDHFKTAENVPDTNDILNILYKAVLLRRVNKAEECYQIINDANLDTPEFWNIVNGLARFLGNTEFSDLASGHKVRTKHGLDSYE